MPNPAGNPNASDFSKVQNGECLVDSSLRKVVKVGAVSATAYMPVDLYGFTGSGTYATALLSFSADTGFETVISAPGAGTKIRVLGVALYNANTDTGIRFQFRFGSTAFLYAGAGPEIPYNHNMVAQNVMSAANKAVHVWANKTCVAPVTVFYTKV